MRRREGREKGKEVGDAENAEGMGKGRRHR
jgi:hypothetical protein